MHVSAMHVSTADAHFCSTVTLDCYAVQLHAVVSNLYKTT